MARVSQFPDKTSAISFPKGTLVRINRMCKDDEERSDFIRAAVERLLTQREARAEKAKANPKKAPRTSLRTQTNARKPAIRRSRKASLEATPTSAASTTGE